MRTAGVGKLDANRLTRTQRKKSTLNCLQQGLIMLGFLGELLLAPQRARHGVWPMVDHEQERFTLHLADHHGIGITKTSRAPRNLSNTPRKRIADVQLVVHDATTGRHAITP